MIKTDSLISKKLTFINRSNLVFNHNLIKKRVGKSQILSVVKGDAYGHGLKECVNTLHQNGSKDFYVARLEDALLIRRQIKEARINLRASTERAH